MSAVDEVEAATFIPKTVAEVVPIPFDFQDLFDDGVTVTLTLKVTEVLSGTDVTNSMKQGNFGLKPTTERTYSQLIKGGTAGKSYYVAAHAVGSDQSEQDLIWILPVVDIRLG